MSPVASTGRRAKWVADVQDDLERGWLRAKDDMDFGECRGRAWLERGWRVMAARGRGRGS